MKKIYNTPSVKVVILNATPILAGSDPQINNDATEGTGGWGSAQAKDAYRFDLVDEDYE